jgi:adenylosuccinate lyase
LLKGLNKLILNDKKLNEDLDDNWAVISEAIQTILRREGYPNPYEALKELTRGQGGITRDSILKFIQGLKISKKVKDELKSLSPGSYIGIIPRI